MQGQRCVYSSFFAFLIVIFWPLPQGTSTTVVRGIRKGILIIQVVLFLLLRTQQLLIMSVGESLMFRHTLKLGKLSKISSLCTPCARTHACKHAAHAHTHHTQTHTIHTHRHFTHTHRHITHTHTTTTHWISENERPLSLQFFQFVRLLGYPDSNPDS